jgi:uncharacterized protein (DUF2267 family)
MSSTGLEVFDTTVQKTNEWLKWLMRALHSEDRNFAYLALRSGMHALRDRMQAEAAIHLGAQLPMLVRGIFYEGWNPQPQPSREHTWEDFVEHVRTKLSPQAKGRAGDCALAVFRLLATHIDGGEARKVEATLPKAIGARWRTVLAEAAEARAAPGAVEMQQAAAHISNREQQR